MMIVVSEMHTKKKFKFKLTIYSLTYRDGVRTLNEKCENEILNFILLSSSQV